MMDDLEIRGPVRCYNGVFDSATQRTLDQQERVLRLIRKREPEAHVTQHYGPDGGYVVHVWGRELSAYTGTRGSAIADAYQRLFPHDPK